VPVALNTLMLLLQAPHVLVAMPLSASDAAFVFQPDTCVFVLMAPRVMVHFFGAAFLAVQVNSASQPAVLPPHVTNVHQHSSSASAFFPRTDNTVTQNIDRRSARSYFFISKMYFGLSVNTPALVTVPFNMKPAAGWLAISSAIAPLCNCQPA
jgi:hypothetical protein